MPFQNLGVVAFSNYVLGFGFVRSDLSLQGATSLGEALRDVDPNKVQVRAAPVIVERSRGGEVWRADTSRVEPLRQSLAIGIRPPDTGRLISERERAARVLVVAPFGRADAERYAEQVRRSLARSAGAPVPVSLVSGADARLAFRTARELDRRPALAVLVAPASDGAVPAVRKVYLLLRARRQEAVAAAPLPSADAVDTGDDATPAGAAVAGKLPVAWLPRSEASGDALAAAAREQRPDTGPGLLARNTCAGARVHLARLRLRGGAPHRRRCRRPHRAGGRRRPGAAAAVGVPGRSAGAPGRRLAAAATRPAALLPARRAQSCTSARRGPRAAARQVSSALTTTPEDWSWYCPIEPGHDNGAPPREG